MENMETNSLPEFDLDSARRLPSEICFGTSTWAYPGWKGLVYREAYRDEKTFKAECLSEYAACPWFRTVGIDSFFYGPPAAALLQRYAGQVPDAFQWVSKVWERITIPRYPKHTRYGAQAGKDNPDFLNPQIFLERVLPGYAAAEVAAHTGPFVFQFPTIAAGVMSRAQFMEGLRSFLSKLPTAFRYAVEVRNPDYLCPEYFQLLNACGATHCFSHWNYMPALAEQMRAAAQGGGLSADFLVARILTPPGVNYQQAVDRFKPYDKIKEPLTQMRADVVRLARRALARKNKAFIIVNNRAEGNAPLTIDAIGRKIAAAAP